MSSLGSLVVNIGANTRDLNKALGQVQKEIQSTTGNIQNLGKQMSMALTLPIAGLGAAAIKSAADLQTMETSFISLTGGAQQAADMMANLNEFAAKTPFQIENIANAARQLIASGTPISEVNDRLQFLGDIAATSGASIEDIASIFAKVNAKGKVELDNLNQLAERGIPIFTALSEATGLPADALGAGAVSVEQFNEVLKSFSQEGGFAAGAMERLSETAAGKFSTALDNLKQAGAALGEQFLPIIGSMLDGITEVAASVSEWSDGTKTAVVVIAGLVAAVGPVLVVLPQMVQSIQMARTAMMALNSTMLANPYIAAAAAIAAVGVAVYALAGNADIAGRHGEKMSEIYQQVGAEVAVNEAKVQRLAAAVEDETKTEEQRAAALRELQKLSPQHFANIDMERVKMGELKGAVEQYRESLLNAAKAKVFSQQLEEAIRKQEELKAEAAEGVTVLDRAAAFMQGTTAQFQMAQRLGGELRATDMLVEELTQKMLELETTTETAAQTTSEAFTPAKTTMTAVATETAKATEAIQLMSMEALQLQELMAAGMGGDLAARGLRQQSTGGDMELQDVGSYEQEMADAAVVDAEDITLANDYAAALDNINAKNQTMVGLTQQIGGELGSMFGTMIKGGEEAGAALKSFGLSVLKTMIGVARAHVIATFSNPMNPVNMATGGIAMPLLIAGGLTLVESLLGAIAFADGGIVSGPTLGLVGEYAGARNNPEVIAPLDKLRDIMADTGGSQQIEVTGRISGNDIELMAERGRKNLRRTR